MPLHFTLLYKISYITLILGIFSCSDHERSHVNKKCSEKLMNFHLEAMIKSLKFPNENIDLMKDDLIMIINQSPRNHIYYGAKFNSKKSDKLELQFLLDLREEENDQNMIIFKPNDYKKVPEFVYKSLFQNLSKEGQQNLKKIGKERIYHWKLSCSKKAICHRLKKSLSNDEIKLFCQRSIYSRVLEFCQNICQND